MLGELRSYGPVVTTGMLFIVADTNPRASCSDRASQSLKGCLRKRGRGQSSRAIQETDRFAFDGHPRQADCRARGGYVRCGELEGFNAQSQRTHASKFDAATGDVRSVDLRLEPKGCCLPRAP